MSEEKVAPRRSLLAQERSRDTRQAIIRAALKLWSERGYDTGVDETTAEEIARRAGVAKATFYYHFARKEDILRETGWLSAKVFYEDALKALINGDGTDHIIDDVTGKLCRRVEKVPRPALRRMLQVLLETPGRRSDNADHFGFQRGFAIILLQGQQNGDVPQTVTPASLGLMFEIMLMAAIQEWAYNEDMSLADVLRERFAVLLAGARNVSPDALAQPGARRAKPRTRAV
jgi:AcrR family transcriptional regulator